MKAYIKDIAYYLPERVLTNDEIAKEFPEWSAEIHMYRDHWIDMMGNQIPGMEDLIVEFKNKGYKLFGLTNWSAETFPLVKHRYKIFGHLDGMLVSGYEHMIKPGIGYYKLLLEKFFLKAEECLFVDDNQANVDAAISVGMNAVRFQNAEHLKDFFIATIESIQ